MSEVTITDQQVLLPISAEPIHGWDVEFGQQVLIRFLMNENGFLIRMSMSPDAAVKLGRELVKLGKNPGHRLPRN